MGINNIGPGNSNKIPHDGNNSSKNNDSKKVSEKLSEFFHDFSKSLKGSGNSSSKSRKDKEISPNSRSSKLSELGEKTSNLKSSAQNFSDVTNKLEEKISKQEKSKLFIFGSKKKESSDNIDVKSSTSSKGLQSKSKSLQESSEAFLESARKLSEKYEQEATGHISDFFSSCEVSMSSFLNKVKSKLNQDKKVVEKSVQTTEADFQSLEDMRKIEESARSNVMNFEKANCCLIDCCGCLSRVKELLKKNNGYFSNNFCKEIRASLSKLGNEISQHIGAIKNFIENSMKKNIMSFRQKIHLKAAAKLLQSEKFSDSAKVYLSSIYVLANVTGFDCKIEKNHISFIKKEGFTLFSDNVIRLKDYVEQVTSQLSIDSLKDNEQKSIELEIRKIVLELSSCSNYLKYMLNLL